MPKPTNSVEGRTVRALREAGAITGPELDAALAALEELKVCPRCEGDGVREGDPPEVGCTRCYGSGNEYVIQ